MLQPGGYLKLVELGLQDCVDQAIDAQRILGYVVYHKGKVIQVPFPLEKYHPFDTTGRTFHNGRFVQRLRNKAASLSNVKLEQGTVTSLIKSGGTIKGVEYKTKTGQCIGLHAPLTIVCDGCVSNLRSSLSKNSKVPRELHNAFILAVDSGGIRAMPCKSMSASPTPLPGAILLGDALNMRHPATGGGMMCALRDVVLLRDLLKRVLDLSNTTELSRCIQLFYNLRKAKASIVNIGAETYYKVSNSKVKDEIWENALYYTSLGDLCSRGPISLLSGIDRCPLELALHLSAMSAVTISRLLLSNPSPAGLWASGKLIYDTMSIICPILEDGVRDLYFNEVNYLANQDDPR